MGLSSGWINPQCEVVFKCIDIFFSNFVEKILDYFFIFKFPNIQNIKLNNHIKYVSFIECMQI